MIKIDSIKISAKHKIDIKEYVSSKYCPNSEISDFSILKKSLDARDKSDIKYVYSVAFSTEENHEKSLIRKNKNVSFYELTCYKPPIIKDTNKWFGIIMNIDYSKLDKNKHGEVEVLNVKLNRDEIIDLLNKNGYYKAYHMSKVDWISIVLNDTLSLDEITSLIDKSYNLVK